MRKTRPMELVEIQAGTDVRDVILGAVQDRRDIKGAADAIGLTPAGLYLWIKTLGGRVEQQTEVKVIFPGFNAPEEPETAAEPTSAAA